MLSEQRRVQEIKYKTELGTEAISEETLAKIEQAIDRKMERFNGMPYAAAPIVVEGKKSKKKEKAQDTGESRFYMLTGIDKEYEEPIKIDYDDEISLREFCEEFRNYSCRKLKLYYDIPCKIINFVTDNAPTNLLISCMS